MTPRKVKIKKVLIFLGVIFIIVNTVAYMHAYKLTHFSATETTKTQSPDKLSWLQKAGAVLTGVNNPRPKNSVVPAQPYQTIYLQSNKQIECWLIKNDTAKGTVIIFHGYGGHKSSMLDKAEKFLAFGYSVLLVDFMGSGGSEGNQTTIGYREAEQVNTAWQYLTAAGEKNIVLFGTSMGAVAIMKAIADHPIKPKAVLLECPFGSMYQTVAARFNNMHLPAFPMADLLVFWGGVQNNFRAFSHKPVEYAKAIESPVLLLYGEKDKNVSRKEIDAIYKNIRSPHKQLIIYPLAGHENYLKQYDAEWTKDVGTFLHSIQ
jgi:alpha-beta hydrolase superfamily lysophospholipase